MYNGVLTLKLPKGMDIVDFADDVALTVTGEMLVEVKMLAIESIVIVENWMQAAKLRIAHNKTEVLLVSNCKAEQRAEITVGEHAITSKRTLKYLGVLIDDRLNFNNHFDCACEKAEKSISAIVRIMPNNAGPCSSKRCLLATVSSSILRYGAPAWSAASQNPSESQTTEPNVSTHGDASFEHVQDDFVGSSIRYRRHDPDLHHPGGRRRVLQT
ncbi:uncharacterized protein LOC129761082 [Toxorhynchites rutilus septentrionalis]|uniref:uncharacterized protein LOC129761082 n=1 Tax=Toxorhynchites rutilus septentrionalis TaxID=329112 RepID=UPI002478CA05|nr:uncharacterized protein LOC129761082 [Toxorhynchites rutilus septentrionalis]